ncbi:hypothetical protein PHMEG_00029657 [Phytophthora megakarya]|uniref:Uncharacterized protein n=1 Tax=Phytophthora megakarya TaxID=4795 RepID=A0A225V304_9STRA|nr:hypothetical protein PHMEG_00029657 [Phytophthora megakarya]
METKKPLERFIEKAPEVIQKGKPSAHMHVVEAVTSDLHPGLAQPETSSCAVRTSYDVSRSFQRLLVRTFGKSALPDVAQPVVAPVAGKSALLDVA